MDESKNTTKYMIWMLFWGIAWTAGKVGAHRTGVFMFIVPVGAIVSSWIVYGEVLALSTLIGCLLAFAAVIMFNMKKTSSRL